MQKITTFLTYVDQAEAAAKHYVSIFPKGKILKVTRNPMSAPGKRGDVLTVDFELEGQQYVALNGGPQFQFTDAVSLMVLCKTQKEIDHYWTKLSKGGQKVQCGWLIDKFGMRWQITPHDLLPMLGDGDTTKAQRVMAVMMTMTKLDIAALKKAYRGK